MLASERVQEIIGLLQHNDKSLHTGTRTHATSIPIPTPPPRSRLAEGTAARTAEHGNEFHYYTQPSYLKTVTHVDVHAHTHVHPPHADNVSFCISELKTLCELQGEYVAKSPLLCGHVTSVWSNEHQLVVFAACMQAANC